MDAKQATGQGPLAGVRIVELGGIGPAPFCGMVLSDLGAEVIQVRRREAAGKPSDSPVLDRGRRSIAIDLKVAEGVAAVMRIIETSDAVIEGFRPGVAERLGLGPNECLARRPSLVYTRITGWGQGGPLANDPGHDINYIGLTGVLHAIGSEGGGPVVPLNLVGDFGGGGMLAAVGTLSALLHAARTGEGQVVDASMVDGSALLLAMTYGFLAEQMWVDKRGQNLLDGGAPFYAVYRCSDGKYVAVGALEPIFYRAMLQELNLTTDPDFADQYDESTWPKMRARLQEIFAERSRDEWAAHFTHKGACVTPVLSMLEAPAHPHNANRRTYLADAHGNAQPNAAPRFSQTKHRDPAPAPMIGADTVAVLTEAGVGRDAYESLRGKGIVA